MTSGLVSCLLMFIVVAQSAYATNTEDDVLQEINNKNRFYDLDGISQSDLYRYYLWDHYRIASRSQRPEYIKDISQTLTRISYLDHTIDMVGLFLFGPQNSHAILRSSRDYTTQPSPDQSQCFKSTLKLLHKHCGVLTEHGLKHIQSLENICIHVLEKADIQEAFIVTCGMNIGPSVIHAGHPTIDVTPAPLRSSSYFCERVSVHGISRLHLLSYATAYRILLVPSFLISTNLYDKIQVCFHRDASLGLCECDDWTSFTGSSRLISYDMSPYRENFVDVKFDSGVYGYVTVTLDEVSRIGLFVAGIGFLFLAHCFSKYVFQWTTRVVAVTCVYLSSTESVLGIVAVGFCIALYYVITCIKAPVLSKMTKLWKWSVGQGWGKESIRSRDEFYSTFHKIPKRKKFSKKEREDFTKELTNECFSKLVYSPEYISWLMEKKNDGYLDSMLFFMNNEDRKKERSFLQMLNMIESD